jgi:hypothetical protein
MVAVATARKRPCVLFPAFVHHSLNLMFNTLFGIAEAVLKFFGRAFAPSGAGGFNRKKG